MLNEYDRADQIIDEIIAEIPDYIKDSNEYELKVFTYVYVKLATLLEYDDYASEVASLHLGGYDRERAYDNIIYPASSIIALARGKALCGGFAAILSTVLDRCGIKNIVVKKNQIHTWNQVCIDGKWYNCDLTNDYDLIVEGLKCNHFLVSNKDSTDCQKYGIDTDFYECEETISLEKQEQLINEARSYIKTLEAKKSQTLEVEPNDNKPNFINKIKLLFSNKKKNGGNVK